MEDNLNYPSSRVLFIEEEQILMTGPKFIEDIGEGLFSYTGSLANLTFPNLVPVVFLITSNDHLVNDK